MRAEGTGAVRLGLAHTAAAIGDAERQMQQFHATKVSASVVVRFRGYEQARMVREALKDHLAGTGANVRGAFYRLSDDTLLSLIRETAKTLNVRTFTAEDARRDEAEAEERAMMEGAR